MIQPILVYLGLAVVIAYLAIKEDGFKFFTNDRDKDGIVQEGTKWERSFFYWSKK